MHRTHALSVHTRRLFGKRVLKIPLDAGFSCPNRDGTTSHDGCVFCNPMGSGSGFLEKGLSIAEQWQFWRDIHVKKKHAALFSAYFQSFSNTHGPIEKLARTLDAVRGLPDLASLSIGTRPDCLDEAKLDLLAAQKERLAVPEVTLELGLQSANNATLKHINRGHDAETFAHAVREASRRGLTVVAHIMAGLPTPEGREGKEDLLRTVEFVNDLPVHGVKFHNVFVCRDTPLARDHAAGRYITLALDEYLHWLGEALMHLSPLTVVHRLNGNPAQGELISPEWASNMRRLHNEIRAYLKSHDIWQSKKNGWPDAPPPWFDPEGPAPPKSYL